MKNERLDIPLLIALIDAAVQNEEAKQVAESNDGGLRGQRSLYGVTRTAFKPLRASRDKKSNAQGMPSAGPVSVHRDLDGDRVEDARVVLANTDPQGYTLKVINEVVEAAPLRQADRYSRILDTSLPLNGDTLVTRLLDELGYPTGGGWLYMYGHTEYARSLPG